MPGPSAAHTTRYGTTGLVTAFTVTGDMVISWIHWPHRAVEFTKFLTTIDETVPECLDVHGINDKYATHKH